MESLVLDKEKHIYTYDGVVVPGVTDVLQSVGIVDYSGVDAEILAAAGDLGTNSHRACELSDKKTLDTDSLDRALIPYLNAWQAFLKEYGIKIEKKFIEKSFYSKHYGFAGTLDRAISYRELLIDIKSSAVLYKAIGPQLGGYKVLYEENTGLKIRHRWGVLLKPDSSYKVEEYKDSLDEQVFLSSLQVHKWKLKNGRRTKRR